MSDFTDQSDGVERSLPPPASIEAAGPVQRLSSSAFNPNANEMLLRYSQGFLIIYINEDGGPIGWRKYSHRGIQFLDRIHIGEKQRRDIFAAKFDIRFDTAFEQVVRACAERSREGHTWITEELVARFVQLHETGFAHSFECWQVAGEIDGLPLTSPRLVGGLFGLQLGKLMTVESMYYRVNNASKAAYVRTLLYLREREFEVVDINNATDFFQRFGAETVPQWKFEEILRSCRSRFPAIADGQRPACLPRSVRARLISGRIASKLKRLVGR